MGKWERRSNSWGFFQLFFFGSEMNLADVDEVDEILISIVLK